MRRRVLWLQTLETCDVQKRAHLILASDVFGREFIQDRVQLLIGDSVVGVRTDVRFSYSRAVRTRFRKSATKTGTSDQKSLYHPNPLNPNPCAVFRAQPLVLLSRVSQSKTWGHRLRIWSLQIDPEPALFRRQLSR